MINESIFTKVRCSMEKVLMGFDERNSKSVSFIKYNFPKAISPSLGLHFYANMRLTTLILLITT